jgi:hypothetical protein
MDLSRLRSLDAQAVAGDAGQLGRETIELLDLAMRAYLGLRI